ncbi:DUF3418 domain-containing protein [Jonesiaceae bacterium BS-20]|uniref:DUF3418 domain-containing protein n=1 Tax=Jonesiaceae bacterium BS-20 TaxID=3120821 RepID=A0AAU7E181_9MICO
MAHVNLARLARAAERRANVQVPVITFPEELPVSARRQDIAAAIAANQVVIVAGETGSGKTTQLPKILLELGRGRKGQIGHTQPRRIAARTVAERIAQEIGTELGQIVGYQVRFTDQSGENTLVKVMTDGILLAQIQRDPQLLAYDTLIIDEAHERSLNIDFLLGYLTRLLPQRPDLKVIITSATIDSNRFARHFAPGGPVAVDDSGEVPKAAELAPVIEVSGRTYPVEIRYRPLSQNELGASPDDQYDEDGHRVGTNPKAAKNAKNAGKRLQGQRPGGDKPGTGTNAGPSRKPKDDTDMLTAICQSVDELMVEGPGDILVFLSGERDIHDTEDALRSHLGSRANDTRAPGYTEILPLYARLSAAEQHRVFQTQSHRRIVLATNVAETSLTVPGIRYVIDPGTARISRFSKATKVQRLPIEPISQASANQRAGRCGRVADGIAIRLFSEEDFEQRPAFTEPEILRTSLASVLLQMISVGVVKSPDDVAKFPFVEPPDTRAIRDGVALLSELGALKVTKDGTALTQVGRQLAQLPMDPRLARMIIEGSKRGVTREVMIIAAVLSIQDPRERPSEVRELADAQHARFTDGHSDFMTYLNLWQYVRSQQKSMGSSAFRRMCRAEYLNFMRIREWQDVVTQLRDMAKSMDLEVKEISAQPIREKIAEVEGKKLSKVNREELSRLEPDTRFVWDSETIHRSLLSGLLSQIGMQEATEVKANRGKETAADRRSKRMARNDYLGARGAKFAIFPGSGLAKKPPAWVMAGELVETSRLWARDVALIDPAWAEELAGPIAKYNYSDQYWSTRHGAAMAKEKVLVYGVPIVADRPVLYSKVDPEAAREMFIRNALVQGEWTTHHKFAAHNQAIVAEAQELEARSRQRGLMVDDEALFGFFDARLPDTIVSARHFDRWWKDARQETPDLLNYTIDLLIPTGPQAVSEDEFPQTWQQGDLTLPLTYQFSPGADADGVTVHIPLAVLNRVVPDGFDWMVPGLLEELCVGAIRALPKAMRRQLVPAPDVGRDIANWLLEHCPAWADMTRAGDMAESFEHAFGRAIMALRDVEMLDDAWAADKLPPHLRMTFRVFETHGTGKREITDVLGESKDLAVLQRQLANKNQDAVRSAVKGAVGQALAEAQAAAKSAGKQKPGTATPQGGAGSGAGIGNPLASTAAGFTHAINEQSDLKTWPAGPGYEVLPEVIEGTGPAGVVVRGYPTLIVEKGGQVALRILAQQSRQEPEQAKAVIRLVTGEVALASARVSSRWSGNQALTLAASPYKNTAALVADLQLAAVQALVPGAGKVRTAADYQDVVAHCRTRIEDEVHRIVGDVVAALTAYRDLDVAVQNANSMALLSTLADIRKIMTSLVYPGFISATPPEQLRHLPRYLRAQLHRLEKAASNVHRDNELAWKISNVVEQYDRAVQAAKATPEQGLNPDLVAVRWMIEELRVSLYAVQLGTNGTVSEKRILKAITEATNRS